MAFLDEFSQEEQDFLISLPYRVGLWVSSSDDTGGALADGHELEALEKSIAGIVHGMFESAFVHEVMAEAFLRKPDWRNWEADIARVPEDCRRAVTLLQGKLTQRDVDSFRRILMQIGLEVARAFREYDKNEPLLYRFIRLIGMGVDRFFGALQGEKHVSEHLLNISYEEDLALNKLAKALRGEVDHAAEHAGTIMNS
ncbi:MAG TPA: hypothetical protein VIF12_04520 [Micavibrio sp.]|jgi:hypothetical protein